ncbi:hypothetical protein [Faecalibaculum rodentium]|uniref:hypothetical protein n=1 Tax=Faecalibaculum rodentium TaxID=1702221 RepID=UPI0023F3486E|nr:hypothetical protein [Faecalibaculum rodentium]
MDIQIAQISNMSQSGSSLLRSIQNNSTPILDLLVRESIQNSLDAAKPDSRSVRVDFEIGEFRPSRLNSFLTGSQKLLNKRFPGSSAQYIAIRDSQTEGLTGKLSSKYLQEHDDYGNLLKLVYEIGQAQDKRGAGGSWGLGKTVYFRVGIGLVVYYSRIQLGPGNYQSRLAVTLVEDENKESRSIIPYTPGKKRRGIAWWGKATTDGETIPLTDDREIETILEVFGIDPYEGTETGTTVIIPYINDRKLLNNNRNEYVDSSDQSVNPFWYDSLEEYLVIAIQRWYAARITNRMYDGVTLSPAVTNYVTKFHEEITSRNMAPAFKVIQDLYNTAYAKMTKQSFMPILQKHGQTVMTEMVSLRNEFVRNLDKTSSGVVAFATVSTTYLQMVPPENLYSPCLYYGLPDNDDDKHEPILAYCRKPGMIVEYTDTGKWVQGIQPMGADSYLIAVFVLNSNQRFKADYGLPEAENTLEDYIRQTENADHMHWEDISYHGHSLKIVQKTQKHVASKIAKTCKSNVSTPTGATERLLSKELGKFLLPPEGFGTAPTRKTQPKKPAGSGSLGSSPKKGTQCTVDEHIRYTPEGMSLHATMDSKKVISKLCRFELAVQTEAGELKPEAWESRTGLRFPFEISEISVDITRQINRVWKTLCTSSVVKDGFSSNDVSINYLKTADDICYGFIIDATGLDNLRLVFSIDLEIPDKSLAPSISFRETSERSE